MAFPSSGTLICAVLETLGGYYQSFILDKLSAALVQPVAVLLYVSAVMIALARFLMRGKLDSLFLWIVIGPFLLFQVLLTRTQSPGTIWSFAGQPRNQSDVWVEVRDYLGMPATGPEAGTPPPNPPMVASLYLKFNNLTSAAVRNISGVLAGAKTTIDLSFILNSQIASGMRSGSVSDTGLHQLIHGPFLRDCNGMLRAAEGMKDETKSRNSQIEQERVYADSERVIVNPREASHQVFDYLATLKTKYPAGFDIAITGEPAQMATWLDQNTAQMTEKVATDTGPTSTDEARASLPETITCKAVWNLVTFGLFEFGARENAQRLILGESAGIAPDEVLSDLLLIKERENLTGIERARMLQVSTRVAASYLLRNELRRQSGAAFINEYSKKGFTVPVIEGPGERDLSALERTRTQFLEWKERSGVFAVASTLPYYQGIGLYILSVAFPFFAVLLVIPGRHSGFLMWFFLWLWLKSWEIGFTVVMLLSDLLFQLFNYGRDLNSVDLQEGWKSDLATHMFALRELDPSFQLTTVYGITGACLSAVPIISSYLILGSLKGGAALMSKGVEALSAPISEHSFMFAGARRGISQRMHAAEDEWRLGEEYLARYKQGGPSRGGGGLGGRYGGNTEAEEAAQIDNSVRAGGNYQGLTGNESRAQAIGAADKAGHAAGVAGSSPYALDLGAGLPGFSGGSTLGPALDATAGRMMTLARGRETVQSQRLRAYLTTREIDLAKETASAPFDTYNLLEVQRRSVISRIAGAFEVPWAVQDGDWDAILDARFAYYLQRVDNQVTAQNAFLSAFPGYDMFAKTGGLSMRDVTAWSAFHDFRQENKETSQDYTSTIAVLPHGQGQILQEGEESVTLSTENGVVVNVNDGLVMFKGDLGGGRGNGVILRHRNGTFSVLSGLDYLEEDYEEGDFILGGKELGRAGTFEFSVARRVGVDEYSLLSPGPLLSGQFSPTKSKELPDDLARIFADFNRKAIERNFEAIPPSRVR